jgi:hypothetical protein
VKNFSREFLFAGALLFVAATTGAGAKGLGGPIRGMLMYRPIEVVVQAHVALGGDAAIMVDKSYYGPYKVGDRVPVEADFYKGALIPGGGSQPELFLVLSRIPQESVNVFKGSTENFGQGLLLEDSLSRRLSDGRVYFWWVDTKTVSYRFWSFFTNTASLTRDETHSDLTSLEEDLTDGLGRHDEWWRAQAATDPAEKLRLLRGFMLPGGPHHFRAYDVWSCTMGVLGQVEKTGPAAVPFLNELLTEPTFQEDYSPDGWIGFGAQERAAVKKSLALVESQAATNPKEKLERLRPVFDLPQYDFRAGFDPVGMVEQYFDRGLSVATSVDAADARTFLHGLLALPQFQESYAPIGETTWGHGWRVKIQAALAGLR